MAKILRFQDFSDSFTTLIAEAGNKVKDCVNIDCWENYIVLVNGRKASEDYVMQEEDYIIIRSIPKGVSMGLFLLGAFALAAGIYGGVKSYQANKAAKRAEEELKKLRSITKDDIQNLPYISGALNSVATGKTQPYIIGRHLFTPYILNGGKNYKGYHSVSGEYGKDSFYTVVLEGGFNKQVLESLYCDDVKVASLLKSPATPQEGVFYFNDNTEFASNDSLIEIAQGSNDQWIFTKPYFRQRIIEQEVSDQLKKANDSDYEDLYYTLERNAKKVELCIMFNGLYQMSSDGTKSSRSVQVIPEYSLDYAEKVASGEGNTATWTSFLFAQRSETIPATSTTQESTYRVLVNSFRVRNINDLVRNKNLWTKVSGDEIRNNSNTTFDYVKKSPFYIITAKLVTETPEQPGTPFNSNTFNYNERRQLRFTASHTFNFSDIFHTQDGEYVQREYPITVRLRCTTNKVTSGSEVSDCYVEWVQSHCCDIEKSKASNALIIEQLIGEEEAKLSTLIGVRIKATSSNQDKIKKIAVVTNGIAPVPTYNASTHLYTWDLSSKEITSNPASWLVEVLTSHTHKASKVSAEEIDLQSFGALWTYCDEENIQVNKVLINSQKKAEVLNLLCSVCHASLYQNIYGKIAVAYDGPKENAIALFNEQNIISFSYEKNIALAIDGLRATFIDSDSHFQENSFVEFYEMGASYGADTILKEVDLDGITNTEQAHRQAFYLMANEKLRPIKATIQIGREGIYFTPYSKIMLQHPALKTGLGNAVVRNILVRNNQILGIELYDAVGLQNSYIFTVIIQCVSSEHVSLLAKTIMVLISDCLELSNGSYLQLSDGSDLEIRAPALTEDKVYYTKELYFSEPLDLNASVIPHAGDVLSYGYGLETVTREFTITGIKPNGTQGYSLECVDYDEAIFDFDSGRIPEYSPTITERRSKGNKVPETLPADTPTYAQTKTMINTVAPAIAEEKVQTKTPRYLGIVTALPGSTANVGDWFTWGGANTLLQQSSSIWLYKGYVYRKVKNADATLWVVLDKDDTANSQYFMAALNDILTLKSSGDGYFSTVFANSLFAHQVFADSVDARTASITGRVEEVEDALDGKADASSVNTKFNNVGTAPTITHQRDADGNEKIKIEITKADGSKVASSYTTIINDEDYLYLGKNYGSQAQNHLTSYTKISKQGLLTADNAIIHGTIYATNGEFSGNVKVGGRLKLSLYDSRSLPQDLTDGEMFLLV